MLLNPIVNSEVLKKAIQSSRNGIVIADAKLPDNPLIYVNPAFMELTGYDLDEIINKNCRFLQGDDRNQPAIHRIHEAINQGTTVTDILRNYRKDGSLFWNELTISPVFDDTNTITHFIGIQNDISSRKEAEREINEFYSVVSHELRTPLSAIISSLSIILDEGNLTKDNSRILTIAKSASIRLKKLIDNILDIKKIEYGTYHLNLKLYRPNEVLKIVVDDFTALAKEKSIKLISKVYCESQVEFDLDKIIRVLGNLVNNAIKFSGPNSNIIISVNEIDNDRIEFRVQDFGIGISPESQKLLFKQFSQISQTLITNTCSSGLGLYICKSLVELHDGSIKVDSDLGKGSTFSFQLPKILSRR